MTDWFARLTSAQQNLAAFANDLAALNTMRDEATAQVLALGRGVGIELNPDAIQASLTKPYVLIPTGNPNEWKVIYGTELANALALPFIHGETRDKYARMLEARQRVVSKAIEASIDLPDLTLVIEADMSRTGESRVSEGQRNERGVAPARGQERQSVGAVSRWVERITKSGTGAKKGEPLLSRSRA